MRSSPIHLVLVVVLLTIWSPFSGKLSADSVFAQGVRADAERLPDDVGVYLHISDGRSLRAGLAGKPMGTWIDGLIEDSEIGGLWSKLATRLQQNPDQYFDRLFGDDMTFATRGSGRQMDWVLMTTAPASEWQQLFRALDAAVHRPKAGHAVRTIPDFNLCIAVRHGRAIIASSPNSLLFQQVMERSQQHVVPVGANLRATAPFMDCRDVEDAQLTVFLRHHDVLLSGWSKITASLQGNQIRLAHDGAFDQIPFTRQPTKQTCDYGAVRALEQSQVLVYAEPTDLGPMSFEQFLNSSIGTDLPFSNGLPKPRSGAADHQSGGVRLVAMSAEEGRLRHQPQDILAPVFSVCVQSEDLDQVLVALDHQMHAVISNIKRQSDPTNLVSLPQVEQFLHDAPRTVDLSPLVSKFTHDLPLLNAMSLSWSVVDGPHGSWYVISTEPNQHQDVVNALGSDQDPTPLTGKYDSVGCFDGSGLAQLFHSWSECADDLAQADKGPQLRATLRSLERAALAMRNVRWTMDRPSPRRVHFEIEIDLATSDSSSMLADEH